MDMGGGAGINNAQLNSFATQIKSKILDEIRKTYYNLLVFAKAFPVVK
jgi:hypothetical protein